MLVYTYNANYDKNTKIGSLDYKKYDKNGGQIESLSIEINSNNSYYIWKYYNKDNTYSNKMLLSIDPFLKPIGYFNCASHAQVMNIRKSLNLKNGFSIEEEIPFGFVYSTDDNDEVIQAKKYGLKDNRIPDYDKLISEYKIINDMLIVKNRFMENYNYIASGKETSRVITQEDLCNGKMIPNIFLIDCPTKIIVADRGKPESDIKIKYDKYGLPISVIVNGEEKCECSRITDTVKSEYPLYWEPFDETIYKDILVNKAKYNVISWITNTDDIIFINREVYKK